ncbi:DUF6392 family protein [Pseudomonas sp. MWU13-2100]|uniref:DUF6392 family protein n=1 Tax=Pseudomonas sp. MWU13-2100 TaxID=2935075 RepID=UPI00200E5BC4|nr:DUF6392 family protein [Pseudomonas sp. MWU13-2100]
MDSATVNRWVKSLGRHYDQLVAEGTIPSMPLQELYEGRDWLDIEPAPGVGMEFWTDTKRLEKVLFTLIPTEHGDPVYKGELPVPFSLKMDQAGVRALLGKPMESKGPVKLPGGLGMRGGWDAYRLQEDTHPNARVGFSYTADMMVKTLAFALINTDHD